ncbi:MAG: DUF1501 domain-containing protein [Planctomycetota bacterium]
MSTTRRTFLVAGLRVSAVLPFLSGREIAHALRPVTLPSSERTLVVVQLTGGNDGLNMVAPIEQDAYFRLRPTLAVSKSKAHVLGGGLALHPAMSALAALHADGALAVVNRAGYPTPDRSHFRSLEIWHTARPDRPASDEGWLGRLADQLAIAGRSAMPSLHIGDEDLPLALRGRRFLAPTARDDEGFELRELSSEVTRARDALIAPVASGDLGFLRDAARSAYGAAERMRELAARAPKVEYPDHELARKLAFAARLIAGGFETRILSLTLGGFDTHARQAEIHQALLAQLSSSLSAFYRDLAAEGIAERALVLVFSEFGRRAAENGSFGTDHGTSAPVLLLGGRVNGGLHGPAPDLEQLEDGDVPFAIDFRAIYAAIERDWMGLAPSSALAPLSIVRA